METLAIVNATPDFRQRTNLWQWTSLPNGRRVIGHYATEPYPRPNDTPVMQGALAKDQRYCATVTLFRPQLGASFGIHPGG
jgi:hypothetical protein